MSKECNGYTKLRDGQSTYAMDDGGCYLCRQDSLPLTGEALAENCRRVCDGDPHCIAFTVARPAILDVHDYYWGHQANCCLERRKYPSEFLLDGLSIDEGTEFGNCHLDAMCWTRYEKNRNGKENEDDICADESGSPPLCTAVWDEKTFTEGEIRKNLDFIRQGCDYGKDESYDRMLVNAYDACKAEVYAESMAIRVVRHKTAVYTHVNFKALGA